jgi:hypothetical protein
MSDKEPVEKQALGILSDSVAQTLGPTHLVSRELRRAHHTLKKVDLFTARVAFNALPGWQRQQISGDAEDKAKAQIEDRVSEGRKAPERKEDRLQGTGRDWQNMAPRRR